MQASIAGKNLSEKDNIEVEVAITKVLKIIEESLRVIPLYRVLKVFGAMADFDTEVTPEQLAEIRKKFESSTADEQANVKYLSALFTTTDALGIVLRGHVLIENELDDCVNAYLVNTESYNRMSLRFAHKVLMARALGMISEPEASFLALLNQTRNKLAHNPKKVGQPRFIFGSDDERAIWDAFVTIPSLRGRWPTYDAARYPYYLRTMVTAIYTLLSHRKQRLATFRLQELESALDEHLITRTGLVTATLMLVRLFPKIESVLT